MRNDKVWWLLPYEHYKRNIYLLQQLLVMMEYVMGDDGMQSKDILLDFITQTRGVFNCGMGSTNEILALQSTLKYSKNILELRYFMQRHIDQAKARISMYEKRAR